MGLAPLDYLLGPCSALALGLLISLGLGDSVTVEPPAPRVKINFLILIKTVFPWKPLHPSSAFPSRNVGLESAYT